MVDILDRNEVIGNLTQLLETLSNARASCTFALNGKWGTGKTFVLKMLEKQLREAENNEKFIVFHYNCWQYDYYDEPLIAIVSAMLDSLEEFSDLVPEEISEAAKQGIGIVVKKLLISAVKNKSGIDLSDFLEIGEQAKADIAAALEEKHGYDTFYAFHDIMEQAREGLSKIAGKQTLVILVDELDRCLPEYAIKTLERLHHLFAGMKNTVVLMALDKEQLENTIQQIFGEKIDRDSYLKKFIDFEVKLDIGKVDHNFSEKYSDYIALFDGSKLEPWTEFVEYISLLLSEMEVRRQEHLIKKVKMIHELLFSNEEKKDMSFLCFELLMAVFSEKNNGNEAIPIHYVRLPSGRYNLIISGLPEALAAYIAEHWSYRPGTLHNGQSSLPVFQGSLNIPKLLIGYSDGCYGGGSLLKDYPGTEKYVEDFKAIKIMLNMIK